MAKIGDSITDTLIQDSLATDTVSSAESIPSLVMEVPPKSVREAPAVEGRSDMESWVVGGMLLLFLVLCFKFRNSYKFLGTLWSNLAETRVRSRRVDGTVRETSFLVILNVVCAFSLGGLLYLCAIATPGHTPPAGTAFRLSMFWCVAISAAYCLVMPLVYRFCGWVFGNSHISGFWTNSFLSAQALSGILLFPLIVVGCFYPQSPLLIIIPALVIYGAGKLIFIYKGLRIFWTDFASHLVFLYYLCTVEIIPLITLYVLSLLTV